MRIFKIIAATAFLLSAAVYSGCGENSNSSGTVTLAVSAPVTAGVATLTALATVTPARTGTLVGIPVTFTAIQFGKDLTGALVTDPVVSSGPLKTDVTGAVSWTYNFPQKSYDTAVQVTVNVDGVTQTVVTPVAKGS